MKKIYETPIARLERIELVSVIATLSEGDQTEGTVHDPDDEVDAGNALAPIRNAWEDENHLW